MVWRKNPGLGSDSRIPALFRRQSMTSQSPVPSRRKEDSALGSVGTGWGMGSALLPEPRVFPARVRTGGGAGRGRGRGPGSVLCPAGWLRPRSAAAAAGPIRPQGRTEAAFPGPRRILRPGPPRPSDSPGRPRPLFGPGLAAAAATELGWAASPSPRVGAARQGQPSTTGSPAVSCLTARCCIGGAALAWVCMWVQPWEHCGSASQLTDTKQLVHSFTEGRDQGSAYANRTALFLDLLAQGNASLRLQRVRVADEGSFTCFVSIRDFGSAAVSLQVAAPYSKPSMTLEPNKDLRPGDTVTITCSSYRGYPEAEVFWQDGQGAPLTGNVTTSQMANEQGLFDVHSVLRVVLGANGTYSCLVRNPVLQQDAHGSITITPQRSPTGAVEVQVPEDPVVALVGTDATLRCSFSPEPGFSLAQLNLIWQLTDTKQLVHSFTEGRDQGSAYANRTALFLDLLAQGNASLRLQRVRVADEGSFTCFVSIRDFGSAAVSLQVAAPYSKPSMTLEPNKDLRPGDTVTITCSSYRGYPEAEVFWQDGQGAPLTGNVTTSQMANEQGLFDVHSVLRVVLGANGTYSCLVRNPVLQQDAHGSVTITGQPMTFPPEALWVTVGLSVCLVALLVALAFVCWRKIKQSCEEENAGAEDQDGEGEGSKTALQPLKHSDSKEDDGQELA
ncbi:CD276 antigen isoform X2 [Macaca mulatta]